MKLARLNEEMPLLFKGNPTFYNKGTEFEVVEETELPLLGKGLKLRKYGCIFDGWQVAKNFTITEVPDA